MKFLIGTWRAAITWIENGDLILPIVLVSAAHYATVLAGRDHWLIAFVIGVLVDLGHYRLVKAAIKYGGWFWLGAFVMTGFAFGFHFAFYEGASWQPVMQAAAIPSVIMFLASLSVKERWAQKFGTKPQSDNAPTDDKSATIDDNDATMTRAQRLDDIRRVNAERNGDGVLSASEIVTRYGISLRQAQRDVRDLTVAQ